MGFEHVSYLKMKEITNSFSSREMSTLFDDINIDLLKLNNIGNSYTDMMFSSSPEQHITLPTRISNNAINLIEYT